MAIDEKKSSQPLYKAAKQQVLEKIRSRVWRPGERLPPDKELASILGMHHLTLAKALNQLREEGYLERYRGHGTFVKDSISDEYSSSGVHDTMAAFLLDEVSPEVFRTNLFLNMHKALDSSGFGLRLVSASNDPRVQLNQIKELIRQRSVSGCIVWSIMDRQLTEEALSVRPKHFPLIFIDRYIDGLNMDFVGFDDFDAGKRLGEHLLELGHRNILIVGTKCNSAISTIQKRVEGLSTAINDFADSAELTIYNDIQKPEELNVDDVMKKDPRATVLVFGSYHPAIFFYNLARQKGIQIPKALSIAAFAYPDDLEISRSFVPESDIITFKLPAKEMVQKAVKLLVGRLGGDQKAFHHIKIQGTILASNETTESTLSLSFAKT